MQELKVVLLAIRLAFINWIFGIAPGTWNTSTHTHVYVHSTYIFKLNSGEFCTHPIEFRFGSILLRALCLPSRHLFVCLNFYLAFKIFAQFKQKLRHTHRLVVLIFALAAAFFTLRLFDKCKIAIAEPNAFNFISFCFNQKSRTVLSLSSKWYVYSLFEPFCTWHNSHKWIFIFFGPKTFHIIYIWVSERRTGMKQTCTHSHHPTP